LARRLAGLPQLRRALVTGALGTSMVELLARHADPLTEAGLISEARGSTVRAMRERLARGDGDPDARPGRATVMATMNSVDALAFERARMLIEAVGDTRSRDDVIEAMLAEGLGEILTRYPDVGLPAGLGSESPARAVWRADDARAERDAELAAEAMIREAPVGLEPMAETATQRVAALPEIRDAVTDGRLGFETAGLVARVAGRGNVDAWIARAEDRTVKLLREEIEAAEMMARVSGSRATMGPPDEDTMASLYDVERSALESVRQMRSHSTAGQMSGARSEVDPRDDSDSQMSGGQMSGGVPLRMSLRSDLAEFWRTLEGIHRKLEPGTLGVGARRAPSGGRAGAWSVDLDGRGPSWRGFPGSSARVRPGGLFRFAEPWQPRAMKRAPESSTQHATPPALQPVTSHELAAQRSEAIRLTDGIRRDLHTVAGAFFEIGLGLRRIKDERLYLAMSYGPGTEYIAGEISVATSQAFEILRVVRSYSRTDATRIGLSRANALLTYCKAASVDKDPGEFVHDDELVGDKPFSAASLRDIEAATKAVRRQKRAKRGAGAAAQRAARTDRAIVAHLRQAARAAALGRVKIAIVGGEVVARFSRSALARRVE
jgi:hypothetical protein